VQFNGSKIIAKSIIMPQTRQLAAIMFTDIVSYTALMGKDEQKAFEFLVKNRALHKPTIEAFNGRWIKELESVHHNIANKKDIQSSFVKEETLKNVKEPVRIYEVMPATAATATAAENSLSELKEKAIMQEANSIAVLPI
jgi:class 3 adenylate cyclase